jgi:hypothetical protein
VISAFIDAEFDLARDRFEGPPAPISQEAQHEAEAFFRMVVRRCSAPLESERFALGA